MSTLSDFEDRVARAVEGMFAGVFRAPVQPAELARAAGKEMDRRKKLGVGKVYAPTLYSVLLSPADGNQLGGFARTLAGELETYLIGYARDKSYEFAARPRVRFLVDDGLKLGRFEIIGELMSAEEIAAELSDEDDRHMPQVPSHPATPHDAAVRGGVFDAEAIDFEEPPGDLSTVTIKGIDHDIALTADRYVLGRLKNCDICLADANASREHAVLEREGTGWAIVDLGSTNGTLVNGEHIDRLRLRDGDVIVIGVSEIVFNGPRG